MPPAREPSVVRDVAWRALDVAFRAWAQAPTGERYRAFLDADRRWREMTETRGPSPDHDEGPVRRPVLAAH